MIKMDAKALMKKAVEFHGHSCPGVTIGVLVAKYILEHGNDFSIDEEIVAIVENDNCSVDALQSLLGTTYGKGNLIHLDYGKNNYTVFNRTNKKAVKLSFDPKNSGDRERPREERIETLLNSNPEDVFRIKEIEYVPPEKARIHESVLCSKCGEPTMSTRIQTLNGKEYCFPCYRIITTK